jgi:anti-anti-sigma factor
MPDLKVTQQPLWQSPKVIVVSVAGQVDTSNGLQVDQDFDRVLQEQQPRHVLLDLRGLTYASSVFFSSLLFWREQLARQGGQLVLFGVRPETASTMRILALDRVLTIRADQASAIDTLGQKE